MKTIIAKACRFGALSVWVLLVSCAASSPSPRSVIVPADANRDGYVSEAEYEAEQAKLRKEIQVMNTRLSEIKRM